MQKISNSKYKLFQIFKTKKNIILSKRHQQVSPYVHCIAIIQLSSLARLLFFLTYNKLVLN